MNFEKIPPVDNGKTLLDLAFRRAREHLSEKKISGDHFAKMHKFETIKIDTIKDILCSRLIKTTQNFPQTQELPPFYQKLLTITLDFAAFKKSLASMQWAIQKIRAFQRLYNSKIQRESNPQRIKALSNEYYGRISSVLKQINPQLLYLEYSRKMMRTYPDIKEMFTLCIYGFPNVGKTTLLNHLAHTKAEVAAYAFTTKSINAGYITLNEQKIQCLDVPGILARDEKLNPIERQAELVLDELANIIIYIFDLSEYSGYSIKKQEQLYQKLKREQKHKIILYLSKIDLTDPDIIAQFKKDHKQHFFTKETIEEMKTEILSQKEKFDEKKREEKPVEVPESISS